MGIVSLTVKDDETLYVTATGLANIADKLDEGVYIPELSQLLRVASMMIAGVMAGAYERETETELNLN
jgi:hypothetical protein